MTTLSLFFYILAQKPSWNINNTDILKRDILMSYDKFVRPNPSLNITNVEVRLSVRHIDVDEDKSIVTVFGWFKMVR